MRCAVCQLSNGLVVNMIVADVNDTPPQDCQLIEIPYRVECNEGWYWTGTTFVEALDGD
jgi:hypothetical protein